MTISLTTLIDAGWPNADRDIRDDPRRTQRENYEAIVWRGPGRKPTLDEILAVARTIDTRPRKPKPGVVDSLTEAELRRALKQMLVERLVSDPGLLRRAGLSIDADEPIGEVTPAVR